MKIYGCELNKENYPFIKQLFRYYSNPKYIFYKYREKFINFYYDFVGVNRNKWAWRDNRTGNYDSMETIYTYHKKGKLIRLRVLSGFCRLKLDNQLLHLKDILTGGEGG